MSSVNDSVVEGFVLLGFKAEALEAKGWPVIEYPAPASELDALIEDGGEMHLAQLLAWMQQYVADGSVPWREYRDALSSLLGMCTPTDDRDVVDVQGDNWSLVCGGVNLDAKLVSFSRDGELLAAAEKNEDGRLRVASYQPLDGSTLQRIISASQLPAPDGTVCMRPDNWEYLGDNACGNGQFYAANEGRSYMSLWEYGFGITAKQERDLDWYPQRDRPPLPAAMLATSIGVYYELGPAD